VSEGSVVGVNIKVWLEVVRESLIIGAILIVVVFPNWTASRLAGFGLKTLKTPFGDVDLAMMQAAAGNVESAHRGVSDAAAALQTISASLPQATRDQISAVAAGLDSTAAQLQVPDRILATAVRAQPDTQASTRAREGWIYLGHVDEAKTSWSPSPTIVHLASPAVQIGDVVPITDDVYIRADSSTSQRNQAAIIGVVHVGERVRITDVAYTHALRGGWFVWWRIALA
jgi:hypothetical protein